MMFIGRMKFSGLENLLKPVRFPGEIGLGDLSFFKRACYATVESAAAGPGETFYIIKL